MCSYAALLSVVPDCLAGYATPNFCPYVEVTKKSRNLVDLCLIWTRAV